MTDESERLAAVTRRWYRIMLWSSLSGLVCLFLTIAILGTMRTPLPPWLPVLFLPVLLLVGTAVVSRYFAGLARAAELQEHVRLARRAVDDAVGLQQRLARGQKKKRKR